MSEITVTYVYSDPDWAGLYVDGELQTEGHSVSVYELGRAIEGNTIESFEAMDVDLLDQGRTSCPEKISDLEEYDEES